MEEKKSLTSISRKSLTNGDDNDGSTIRFSFSGRMLELIEGYNAAVQILYPHFPWYIYPGHLLYSLYCRYLKYYKGKYCLKPIPNQLYELLIKKSFIKSEHVVFTNKKLYDQYAESVEVNFVNLIISCTETKKASTISSTKTPSTGASTSTSSTSENSTVSLRRYSNENGYLQNAKDNVEKNEEIIETSENLIKQILQPTTHTIVVQILPIQTGETNCIFIQENFFGNLLERFGFIGANERQANFWAELDYLNNEQTIPSIAIKANIYVLPTPYELPTDLVDLIISNYLSTPRLLHRGHTYRIDLTPQLVGTSTYAHYYLIFAYLKQLYFRCVHLEVKGCEFEMQAIVVKNLTTLSQTTHTHQFLPRQLYDSLAFVEAYPKGLQATYDLIRSSLDAFLPKESACLSSKHIYPIFLLQGERGSGKTKLMTAVAQDLGLHLFGVDCAEIVSQIPSHTEMKLKSILAKSQSCEPLLITLHNFEIFGIDVEGHEDQRLLSSFQGQLQELFSHNRKHPVLIFALSNERTVKPLIQRLFLEVFSLDVPTQAERFEILKWLHIKAIFKHKIFNHNELNALPLFTLKSQDFFMAKIMKNWSEDKKVLRAVAEKTQGFLCGDLALLHQKALNEMKLHETKQAKVYFKHFAAHLTKMQGSFADSLGAPKVPKVLWSDIGGLAKLKDEIQSSIGLPLKHMHLMGKNLRRSGILLYGPPGTGKTLVAKAVATECNLSFLSVQGPELLNMYVGQSEQNVREVFLRARSAAPCVLFLDELDSLAPNRGVAGDSGGVMDRVVSQLLAEMDGIGDFSNKPIFILAATNRPDLIDPALLRPGRFDKLFYVGPCATTEEKSSVLKAQTKLFHLASNFDMEAIAEKLRGEMSGADLYSICSNAWLAAVRRTIDRHQKGEIQDGDLVPENVVVEMDDFTKSFGKFIPSISRHDLEYFNKLKQSYSP